MVLRRLPDCHVARRRSGRLGVLAGAAWAVHGVAVAITAILLLAIRNEWDLITWLAPMGKE